MQILFGNLLVVTCGQLLTYLSGIFYYQKLWFNCVEVWLCSAASLAVESCLIKWRKQSAIWKWNFLLSKFWAIFSHLINLKMILLSTFWNQLPSPFTEWCSDSFSHSCVFANWIQLHSWSGQSSLALTSHSRTKITDYWRNTASLARRVV